MQTRAHPLVTVLSLFILILSGCAAPRISILEGDTIPLKEYTLEGTGGDKILLIPVQGTISDQPQSGLFRKKPSMVQEIVSQLDLAAKDKNVKAVLLKVDSPGGSVTASDLLYHEILRYKQRSGAKVVVSMMNVAASGGYYISLAADSITAHPTSVTGSVGVIFIRPKVTGLMEKIGVDVEVNKTGKNKDAGSPFRPTTPEEEALFQKMTDDLGRRFFDLVKEHRNLDPQTMAEVSTAKVFLADQALKLKLIDRVGYLDDAVEEARILAGMEENPRVVVYRRLEYPNDNLYNTATSTDGADRLAVIQVDLPVSMRGLDAGFYFIWPAAIGE